MAKFNKGDKVKLAKDAKFGRGTIPTAGAGRSGIILDGPDGQRDYAIKIGPGKYYCSEEYLTLVTDTESDPFPVGCRVTCKKCILWHGKHQEEYDGFRATVIRSDNNDHECRQVSRMTLSDGTKGTEICVKMSCLMRLDANPSETTSRAASSCSHGRIEQVYLGIGPSAELINVCKECKQEIK